jgi:hypothetical protein
MTLGFAGVYAPPDLGLREDGVLSEGPVDVPQWVYAELDLRPIEGIRWNGRVANHDHWADHMNVRGDLRLWLSVSSRVGRKR